MSTLPLQISFTRYKLQRGPAILKPVRRCSSSFSRFTHGKIGTKLVEYTGSDEEKEEGATLFVEEKEVVVIPDFPEGSRTYLVKKGVQKEPVVVVEVPDSLEEVTAVFFDPPTAPATSGSANGRKRSRFVFTEDYSEWDPDYMTYLRDKYPYDFPPTN